MPLAPRHPARRAASSFGRQDPPRHGRGRGWCGWCGWWTQTLGRRSPGARRRRRHHRGPGTRAPSAGVAPPSRGQKDACQLSELSPVLFPPSTRLCEGHARRCLCVPLRCSDLGAGVADQRYRHSFRRPASHGFWHSYAVPGQPSWHAKRPPSLVLIHCRAGGTWVLMGRYCGVAHVA